MLDTRYWMIDVGENIFEHCGKEEQESELQEIGNLAIVEGSGE